MKVLMKLNELEAQLLRLKGERREEVMKEYRRLLRSTEDEPIYLTRH